eukprot:scaffold10670_cov142-Isochrysis_galbana.AAC.9
MTARPCLAEFRAAAILAVREARAVTRLHSALSSAIRSAFSLAFRYRSAFSRRACCVRNVASLRLRSSAARCLAAWARSPRWLALCSMCSVRLRGVELSHTSRALRAMWLSHCEP